MKKITLSVLLVLLTQFLWAEKQISIAVLDVESQEAPSIVTRAVSDVVRSEFTNIGNFSVVERDRMNEIIEEQKLMLSGMMDEESATEIGQLLSAQKLVVGELNPLGEEYILTLRIIDVESGQAEYSTRGQSDLDHIDSTAEEAARELAQLFVTGYKEYFTALTPSGYYVRNIIPGLGQFYADRNVEGGLFMGLNVLAAGTVVAAGINYLGANNDYHNLSEGAPQAQFDAAFADLEEAQQMVNYSMMIMGGAYLLHWLDALLIARPDFSGEEALDQGQLALIPWMDEQGNLGLLMSFHY